MQSFFRKNRILFIIALSILVIVSLAFIPATEKDYIVINAPLNNTLSAIQQLPNWKKWHPALATSTDSVEVTTKRIVAANDTIDVLRITAFGILVRELNEEQQALYSLLVRPNDDTQYSTVEIRFRTTILKLLFDEVNNLTTSNLNPILNELRKYLENTQAFYGYPIQFREVTDTLVITTSCEAAAIHVPDSLSQMFNRLNEFTARNNLSITDSPIAYIQRTSQEVKKLMAGLPVNKEVRTTASLEFQRMPQGRMLTVDFSGNYREIQKAYTAADRYINDHNLKTVALPYERYYTRAASPVDSTDMKIRIYYPIL